MNTTYNTRAIFNSKHRTSGTATNPVFRIDPYFRNVSGFSVDLAIVPVTMYVIDAHNNTFLFSPVANYHPPLSATIASRNYPPTELAAAVKAALASTNTVTTQTYNCTYNTHTLKFTLSASVGYILRVSSSINSVLGFSTSVDTSVPVAGVEASEIMQLNVPEYLILKSKTLGQLLCHNSTYVHGVQKSNTLCTIPIDQPFGTFVHYKPNYRYTFTTPEKHLNSIDLQLVDPDTGIAADLNGYGFTVSLTFYLD